MDGKQGHVNDDGQYIGASWETPYGWFADPLGCEIQAIPCGSLTDAIDTIKRLGIPNPNHPQNWH